MSEYTAKALIEPRDYRVVFVIQENGVTNVTPSLENHEVFGFFLNNCFTKPALSATFLIPFLPLSHLINNLHKNISFVTSLCTVLLLIPNCFAVCRTVALLSII